MDNGITELSNVEKLIESRTLLTYRIETQYIDGAFQVVRLIIGAPAASWSSYKYKNVVFLAGSEAGTRISTWLTEDEIILHDQRYPIPSLQLPLSFQRRPSHTSYLLFALSKPYTVYYAGFSKSVSQSGEVLASEDAPFFLSQYEAERSLLYDRDSTNPLYTNDQLPNAGVTIYLEHDEAWLERIHFSSSVLEITFDGTHLSGTRLKVTGTGIEDYDGYPSEKTIALSAPDGPPDIVRIALIKGDSWMDYFYDDSRSRYNPFASRHTNVVFDYQEPGEEIIRLMESGEGRSIEFKGSESDDKDKWKKTVVAFANTDGGYILFGVNNDGQPVGLGKDIARHGTLEHFKDGLTDAISNSITPVPQFEFLPPVKIEENDVLAFKIISDDQAHSLLFEKAHHFYIRRDATTRDANNFEIQELVRQKDMRKGIKPGINIPDTSSF